VEHCKLFSVRSGAKWISVLFSLISDISTVSMILLIVENQHKNVSEFLAKHDAENVALPPTAVDNGMAGAAPMVPPMLLSYI